MARFFFHIRDTAQTIDREGIDFSSADDARTEAVVAAGEALKDYAGKFWAGPELRIWVTDEANTTVCALRISADC